MLSAHQVLNIIGIISCRHSSSDLYSPLRQSSTLPGALHRQERTNCQHSKPILHTAPRKTPRETRAQFQRTSRLTVSPLLHSMGASGSFAAVFAGKDSEPFTEHIEDQAMEVEALESIYVEGEFNCALHTWQCPAFIHTQRNCAVTASREDGNPLAFTLDLRPHADGDGINHGKPQNI